MPAYNPHEIEPKWQKYWEEHNTFRALDNTLKPKLYILDMFPYPSGEGLHVGHPEGYTATDMWCRYQRMRGFNVLHPMGYDAFGLPAEQYAIQTGTHPRVSTERNVANIRRQIKRLGFSYDWDREIATTDPAYVKWTQWIFLVLHDTWFDADHDWIDPVGRRRRGRGRSIAELPIPNDVRAQSDAAVRRYQDTFRLAFQAEAPVNWCEALAARCSPTRRSSRAARSAATIPSSASRSASGCCASPPTPTGSSRTSSPWPGRRPARRCSATGSAVAKGRRSTLAPIAARSACTRRAPTRCLARRIWCLGPSIRWLTSRPRTASLPSAGRTAHQQSGEARHPHQHRAQP